MSSIEERLADLEARVFALEAARGTRAAGEPTTGDVTRASAVLAAAGHPARLRILQLLVSGPRPVAELQGVLHVPSQGQLYHHLKTLTSAGLVEQPERGVYRVPSRAILPVLTLTAAAVDVAAAPARTQTAQP
ncbi:ArsR/SmtB family transcription factor [Nonomuraea lactucae]|uniref:ArsR/SmtB family transcription factor n=1 Tax=Nonomuraea lactucae TaxID=2249762 RepID=UPI000DE51094|nr:helix-turn-helix domain-containing protein [Nonomuraea lactucae]